MSIILNKEELATSELRKSALEILEAGYSAIDTEKILKSKIILEEGGALCIENTGFQCSFYERIFFIGIGKCAFDGAEVIEDILGDYLTDGIALDVKAGDLKRIKSYAGTHPYPSEQNVEATKQILKMVENLTENDLVITLISGGGSALFDLPDEAVTAKLRLPSETSLETIIRITKELTAKGTDIYELNKVRKEMSQVKGGKFAEKCFPAQVISLIFSDVLGNDISMVASGPTVLDEPNEKVKNILLVSNHDALKAMKIKAEELGYKTFIETEKLSGNASEAGKELALRIPKPKTCILLGGETTVKVRGKGIGGRNQEMALSALPHMPPDSILICAASDGWDNTDHAGALVDADILAKAREIRVSPEDYLARNDSYNFFKKVGGAICTGRLGSNVSDLYILLYK